MTTPTPPGVTYDTLDKDAQIAQARARLGDLEREHHRLMLAEAEAQADPNVGGNAADRAKARQTVAARMGAVQAWIRGAQQG